MDSIFNFFFFIGIHSPDFTLLNLWIYVLRSEIFMILAKFCVFS